MQLPNLKNAKEIASGGEGKIFEHPVDKTKVIKLYHQAQSISFEKHLKDLSSLSKCFITPLEIYTDTKTVLGFSMNYVNFNDYWLFNNLFNKGFCTSNQITKDFKINVLIKLKYELEQLHSKKIVIGDLNQYNLFVSKQGEILFVDVDSYQTQFNSHSGVLLDEIRDWATNVIDSKSDAWAFDILTFWATTYCHPFKWMVPGNKETLEQRVKTHKSILSNIPGIKIPPLYDPPTGEVLKQFTEIFHGRRYMIDYVGTQIPVNVVIQPKVASQKLNIRELYADVTCINACVNQIAVRLGNNQKWELVETISKIPRKLQSIKCDQLYPSETSFAYVITNSLFGAKGTSRDFFRPQFYFSNGALMMLDYSNDLQYNFNIENQLSNIDCTQTSVFAKSVLFRSAPIQNFGAKKYLNIPVKNTYQMIEVPFGTKDAVYNYGVIAIENKIKNKIEFELRYNNKTITELDHLPKFAVKEQGNSKLIFVPCDGEINVYDLSGTIVASFDVSICTEDSELFLTQSGILLLDNNILYLLNVK